jgi:hypothetical protein
VLGNGTLVTASQNKNPELFWALRGAGHNFEIVTSMQVKVYDVPGTWTVYSLVFSADKVEALFELINSMEEEGSGRPKELAINARPSHHPPTTPSNTP